MGDINVKNTIFEALLQNIAPHLCSGCAKLGTFLCDECKNDIIYESFEGCVWCDGVSCRQACSLKRGVSRLWVVGVRHSVLKEAINRYKFRFSKDSVCDLAFLLQQKLPLLPAGTIVTAIPTLPGHVRARGFDHAQRLARQLAISSGLTYTPLLERVKAGTQHTAGRVDRAVQAEGAYKLRAGYDNLNVPILLIDDIITTGATISAATQALRGASNVVFVAALAYQPLDEPSII